MFELVYLDNAATTQPSKLVCDWMKIIAETHYGNPSSLHNAGKNAKNILDEARCEIADIIGAKPQEIYFTSGGSESDNIALRGIVPHLKAIGRTTIITSRIEHHAVLHTCQELEKDGMTVIYMPVDGEGRVDIEEFERILKQYKDSVGLVSIMTVNNEIGSIQLIEDIGDLCQEYGAIFMTDAVQAFCKVPLNVNEDHIDMMSMSGHKIHAPKGIGVLYVRDGIPLSPVMTGGGQERGLRCGTENVSGAFAMAKAAREQYDAMERITEHCAALRKTFLNTLQKRGVEFTVNGVGGIPSIISLTLHGCESEAVLLLLNERDICVSAGSACNAGSLDPSHVLQAIYLSDEEASCTIRVSTCGYTTEDDVICAANAIADVTQTLKAMMK